MSDTKISDDPNRLSFQGLMSNRRFLILALMAVVGVGFYLNWGWLAAFGAAPIILALAPCAVMCGLGLCMKGGSKYCASKTNPTEEPGIQRD